MSSFPAGKYARYKRATAFFLDWLLRARGRGQPTGTRVDLKALDDVVRGIAAEPTSLSPKLLQELPKALAACQCAIFLREHVATFFAEDDAAQQGHRHFLQLLKSWHLTLMQADAEPDDDDALLELESTKLAMEMESTKFENYYEVLQVDEDYFPDEEAFVPEMDAPKTTNVDRERLFDEAFTDELRMELVCLFMELDELLEGVYNVYCEVKQEKRTMVEATVVVKLAIDTVGALTAELQLKYPTLRSAKDMYNIVRNISQKNFRQRILQLHESIRDDVLRAFKERGGVAKYVPGTFLIELLGVGSTLDIFVASLPPDNKNYIFVPGGELGEAYGEDRTPEYVLLPDTSSHKVFLLQQLPMVYNVIVDRGVAEKTGMELAPMDPFLLMMEEFFTTREVTILVVFACSCWMKSVAALQGRGGLGRNISLTHKHSTELMGRMEAGVEGKKALLATNKAHNLLLRGAAEIKQYAALRHLGRANPLFAGLTMLGHQFQYLDIAHEVMFATSLLHAFGHLYHALVQEGYLEHILFFDEVLDVYGQEIFIPSRTAAIHGGYYRTYLLSSNLRASAIDAVYRGEDVPFGGEAYKKRNTILFGDVSKIFRLMGLNDKSVLSGGSWKDILETVSDVCSKELFDSRVLSRDLLRLNEDLMNMFPGLIKVLSRQDDFMKIIEHPIIGESRQQRLNRALEESVMKFLMPLLDAMQSDGSLDTRALPGGVPAASTLDTSFATNVCRETAAVIKARFATPIQIGGQRYFTFPSQPHFATQEYGRLEEKRRGDYKQVFEQLMKLLKKSKGPLTGSDLEKFKFEIKRDPDLMGLISENPEPGVDPMYGDLCSLLHQVAAGPAHDADLVDWMIQMGALIIQPTLHCRKAPLQKDLKCPRELYPNTMALHNAAIAGYKDIVRVILEVDNMMDLDTPTFHTKETLAHLAVKNGHWSLYETLQTFGADLRIKDGLGRAVSEVTPNKKWARKIAECTAKFYSRSNPHSRGPTTAAATKTNSSPEAETAHFSQKRSSAREKTSRGSTEATKKRNKRSKHKTSAQAKVIMAAAAAECTSMVESARVLVQLLATAGCKVDESLESENLSVLETKLRKQSATLFCRLRDPDIPAGNKTRDAINVGGLIKALRGLVSTFSEPSRLISARHHIRLVVASEAVHGVHLVQKLNRVLHNGIELTAGRQICESTSVFAKFAVGTARLCVSVDRTSQAREVLDVLEKRFLKTPFDKRVPSEFRELVQMYSAARESMGLSQTSSSKTLRSLEWYLTSAVDDYKMQLTLDGLAGRPVYFEVKPSALASDDDFGLLAFGINAITELKEVVCLGNPDKRIVYGGTSKAELGRVLHMVVTVADRLEVPLDTQTMQSCVSSIYVGSFELSSAGILRNGNARAY